MRSPISNRTHGLGCMSRNERAILRKSLSLSGLFVVGGMWRSRHYFIFYFNICDDLTKFIGFNCTHLPTSHQKWLKTFTHHSCCCNCWREFGFSFRNCETVQWGVYCDKMKLIRGRASANLPHEYVVNREKKMQEIKVCRYRRSAKVDPIP